MACVNSFTVRNYVNYFYYLFISLSVAYICLSVSPFYPIYPHLSPLYFLFSFSPIIPALSIHTFPNFHAYQLIIIHFIFAIS